MARYLDPKADPAFKRVFGEHPNLLVSLLNSLLPLPEGEEIAEVEYLSPERVPRTCIGKNSIVDVFCKTADGRRFIVEMQTYWTSDFKDRALFNSAKVYVDQLERSDEFSSLRPVYSLNLVDAIFEKEVPEFIHHYRVVHEKYTDRVIEGLHLIFVELKKFKPQTIAERKMAVLWLRFLTEIGGTMERVPAELMESSEIRQAVELVEVSAFTREQLLGYDMFLDAVRVARSITADPEYSYQKGMKEGETRGRLAGRREGREEGLKEGKEKGREEGLKEGKLETARKLKSMGLSVGQIAAATGLDEAEIAAI